MVYIQLRVWFPHHKSHVTLIHFLEILSTYVYIFFQLWLYKYLDISVTDVYIFSSNRAVVEGILPCPFPWCSPCLESGLLYSQSPTRILEEGNRHYHASFLWKFHPFFLCLVNFETHMLPVLSVIKT